LKKYKEENQNKIKQINQKCDKKNEVILKKENIIRRDIINVTLVNYL